ncbi:MAG: hypothetical protein NTV54_14035 [Ignavibacteriales bacterium]|nr:hypothetical protein [Ignavibacteriales bacterium]
MAESAMNKVLDAIDIETYLACRSEHEGKTLALKLGQEMNLGEIDIMFQEFDGFGVRVRLRKYVHKPGAQYGWLAADHQEAKG